MYTAIELSKYIVTKCVNEQMPISNLQLQKILFYVQKAYLENGSLAFQDTIEAWQFGPVVPNSYYRFAAFGGMPITRKYDVQINSYDQAIINPIVTAKRAMNPWDLVRDTHRPGGAWDKTYCNGVGNKKEIPIQLIKEVG